MASNRHMFLALAGVIIIFAACLALFVWPRYREHQAINQEITDLQRRIDDLSGQTEQVAHLAGQVEVARGHVQNELKIITEKPELADVIRRLSLKVDGATVLDQSFAAGTETDAAIGRPELARAMPLTVELEARFDSVFALLRAAETMGRLVRISSVQLSCNRLTDVEPPIIEATLGLDAIYASSTTDEGDRP